MWTNGPGKIPASPASTSSSTSSVAGRSGSSQALWCGLARPGLVAHEVAPAGELRAEPQQRRRVTGRVDLWQEGDEPVRGVSDKGAQLIIGVEGAVGLTGARGPACLDAPALIVGEVQVQQVELVQGGQVDHLPDLCGAAEP